ncbi:hypothetical protein KI387_016287, partial [Taxus chinensis]
TNIVLGVQWLHSLGEFQTNFQTMEMKFKSEGRNVILRGSSSGHPELLRPRGSRGSIGMVGWIGQYTIWFQPRNSEDGHQKYH